MGGSEVFDIRTVIAREQAIGARNEIDRLPLMLEQVITQLEETVGEKSNDDIEEQSQLPLDGGV
jgi:hypothetical protein